MPAKIHFFLKSHELAPAIMVCSFPKLESGSFRLPDPRAMNFPASELLERRGAEIRVEPLAIDRYCLEFA